MQRGSRTTVGVYAILDTSESVVKTSSVPKKMVQLVRDMGIVTSERVCAVVTKHTQGPRAIWSAKMVAVDTESATQPRLVELCVHAKRVSVVWLANTATLAQRTAVGTVHATAELVRATQDFQEIIVLK